MNMIISGLLVFFAIHLLPLTPANAAVKEKLSENSYKGIFSLISLAGFALIIYGSMHTESIYIWTPPFWGGLVTFGLMPFAFILVVASLLSSNISRIVPHPMLSGVLVWSLAHLIASGSLSAMVIFISFGLYALVNMRFTKKAPKADAPRYSRWRDSLVILIGLAAYIIIVKYHAHVSGLSLGF